MSSPTENPVNCVLRTLLLILVACFLFTCIVVAGHAATPTTPDAEAILKRSDTYRNGWPSYVLHVKITSYESGKSDEEKLYEVYLPDTSRPVRITPLERLSGDASNGDVARTNYAADYTPTYLRTEKVGDAECHVLILAAKRKGATYQQILFWVRVQDDRPVKAEFHLTSGKLIKSATFDQYASIGGHLQLARMTLYDEIRHNSHSVLEYSGIAPRELPDKLFYQGRTDRF